VPARNEPQGVTAYLVILRDGDLVVGQWCLLRESAGHWADEQRQLIERGFHN